MQKIKIANVDDKIFRKRDGSGEGHLFIIKDDKGNEYTSFDAGLKSKTGATIEAEIKVERGKPTIAKYTVLEQAQLEPGRTPANFVPLMPPVNIKEIKAHLRMCALDNAVRYSLEYPVNGDSISKIDSWRTWADKFLEWLEKSAATPSK